MTIFIRSNERTMTTRLHGQQAPRRETPVRLDLELSRLHQDWSLGWETWVRDQWRVERREEIGGESGGGGLRRNKSRLECSGKAREHDGGPPGVIG